MLSILTRCLFTYAQLERMDRQTHERNGTKIVVTVTVTVTINGLVKLSAFNAHICPSKYLASF